MKKIMVLLFVIFAFYPIVVNANIVCNDGTTSPSCSTCHKGCCSRHGGCSSNSSSSPSSSSVHSNGSSSSSIPSSSKPVVTEPIKSSDTSLKKVIVDEEDVLVADNMFYSTTKENVTIFVVANDSKAALDYEKNPNLIIGENVIYIKVTAENNNVKNYKLNITREKILSNNKNIKVFVMGNEILFHSFKSNVISLSHDKDQLNISYELEDPNAKVEIIGNENLQVGYNEIIVRVIAENEEEQDYTLIVRKDKKEEKKEEEQDDIQVEVIDNQVEDEDDSSIFEVLGYSVILGGAGYFIYNKIKNRK